MDCLPIAGTNKIYCSFHPTVHKLVKPGDFVLLENYSIPLQVTAVQQLDLPFLATLKDKVIIIQGEINSIAEGDEIKLLFDTYEINCCLIKDSGRGFHVKDKFMIGGNTSLPKDDGTFYKATAEVTAVDERGRIRGIAVRDKGCFLSRKHTFSPVFPRSGESEATLEIVYDHIGKQAKKIHVKSIWLEDEFTKILVDGFENMESLSDVVVGIEKYEITVGDIIPSHVKKCQFSLINQFTNFLSLALLSQNCFNIESIINRNLTVLDLKFKELTNRIETLERKLGNE